MTSRRERLFPRPRSSIAMPHLPETNESLTTGSQTSHSNASRDVSTIAFGEYIFDISRPMTDSAPFGLVFQGPASHGSEDYLHDILLAAEHRNAFLDLIDAEGLVVCLKLRTSATTYRKVRGKSSGKKLSQAEYYHHDGCSCPVKPRVVEIRLPYQDIERQVATAVAPFKSVVKAMLTALPSELANHEDVAEALEMFTGDESSFPAASDWDKIQGRVLRLARRKLDAEACRAYYRDVDRLAGAYDMPWQMGESRLMLNNHADLSMTMQHRRAYQKTRESLEQNGSLVKRWTAEEA